MPKQKSSKATKKKATPRKRAPRAEQVVSSSPMQTAEDKRYRIEDDMRTLSRAEEVRSTPARLGAVRKEIRRLSKVARGGT